MKYCPHCKRELPLSAFGKDRSRKDGLKVYCRECRNASRRVENMTPEQIERHRARNRVENMTPKQVERNRARKRVENMTPEQIERKRARNRVENLTAEQIERKRARNRVENLTAEQIERKRASNRVENMTAEQIERNRARAAERDATLPRKAEKFISHSRTRAAELGVPTIEYTAAQLLALAEDADYRCTFCGDVATGWDHIRPMADGGANALYNLAVCCGACNNRKGMHTPYAAALRILPEATGLPAAEVEAALEKYICRAEWV